MIPNRSDGGDEELRGRDAFEMRERRWRVLLALREMEIDGEDWRLKKMMCCEPSDSNQNLLR